MNTSRDRFLETADRIGSRLCRDAVWSGDACNWMGWTSALIGGQWTPVYQALGPSEHNPLSGVSLYSGTAGIALFLARLAGITSDRIQRRTVSGVVNQIRQQPLAADSIGYYTGTAGVHAALIEIGCALEDSSLVDHGLAGLERIEPQPDQLDMMEGSAGLVPLLLDAAARFDRSELIDAAVRHGQHLLDAAHESDDCLSWDTVPVPVRKHLTGFSHGASGIACSLLQLNRSTGEERFLAAALAAMRYERSQFDAFARNWIDHRIQDADDTTQTVCRTAWCHGAPGIALARLAARSIVPDDSDVSADLAAALDTTVTDARDFGVPGERDWCLCHGRAGNADILLTAADLLEDSSFRDVAETVGDWGIERIRNDHLPWPCNVGGEGEHPGLMTGLAGAGAFYLRLFDSAAVPSVLVPGVL